MISPREVSSGCAREPTASVRGSCERELYRGTRAFSIVARSDRSCADDAIGDPRTEKYED